MNKLKAKKVGVKVQKKWLKVLNRLKNRNKKKAIDHNFNHSTAQPTTEPSTDTLPTATAIASPENNVQAGNSGWMWVVGLVVAVMVLAGGVFVVRWRDGGMD